MPEGMLTKDEIDALLAEVASVISKGKKRNIHDTQIALTLYGKNRKITHTSVHLFEYDTNRDKRETPAEEYCKKVNELEFAGNEWIYAKIINENEIIELKKFDSLTILLDIDDRSVQKIIRETDKQTLASALKKLDSNVSEKIFRNMSKRGAAMLREDMEYMGPMRLRDIEHAQQIILSIIRHLEDTGEIVIFTGTKED